MRAQIPGPTTRLDPAERTAQGKVARRLASLDSHADFTPAPDRDPVGLLLRQDETRVQTERDHAALEEAVDSGRTTAVRGV